MISQKYLLRFSKNNTYFDKLFYRHMSQSKDCLEFSDGAHLTFETGKYATMADGSALATIGNTSVLVTAVSKDHQGPPLSFVPLAVDYRQKYAAAGFIPKNFIRREMTPSEKEILTSRVIDRSLRPLFPKGFSNETQISCQLMAVDGVHDPDVISINAASVALALSDIPWKGPVGAVRIGFVDGRYIVFPTRKELAKSKLNLIVAANENDKVVMLEGSGDPISIDELKQAIEFGVKECQSIVNMIKELQRRNGKTKKTFSLLAINDEVLSSARILANHRMRELFCNFSHSKLSRDNEANRIREEVYAQLYQNYPTEDPHLLREALSEVGKEIFRSLILKEDIRCDGRGLTDLRKIECQVDLFSNLHGSSLFRRGQTQVQCTVAYDSLDRKLREDPLLQLTGGSSDKNFLLHYSFPSFANNEIERRSFVSRREIGHGALAAKALNPLLPKGIEFSVLLMATVMESNGSSSMATVCGGSMALMDAGVNLASPAAGVAMGLVAEENSEGDIKDYKILTDILGIEDYLGDMDFKIAGTKLGVTALQADIKLPGVPIKIIMEALDQSLPAKGKILKIMNKAISQPAVKKENSPVSETMEVPLNRRSSIIGAGGLNFRKIESETGAQLSFTLSNSLSIFAPNKNAMKEAKELIQNLMESEPNLEFGRVYTAEIVDIKQSGVMVKLYDNMNPILLHNSMLDVKPVANANVLGFKIGDKIKVKYFGEDPNTGHKRISRKAYLAINLPVRDLLNSLKERNTS